MSHEEEEQPSRRYPPTYHTPRAEATYEQCPWDRKHVETLYGRLRGRLFEDGLWRDISDESSAPRVGRYRVRGGYFQAVFAGLLNPVFEQLAAMEPVETDADAEWEVWHLDEPDGSVWYAMSSTFSTTPGQFAHQSEVDDWLFKHGLGLEFNDRFVEGVAYFETIEPGCVGDAMRRLHWLEGVLADLNERLEKTGARFWARLKRQSDLLEAQNRGALGPDEIVPLPEHPGWEGKKRRAPVPPL